MMQDICNSCCAHSNGCTVKHIIKSSVCIDLELSFYSKAKVKTLKNVPYRSLLSFCLLKDDHHLNDI